MSTQPEEAPRSLPPRPNLRHLKDQAKDLLKAGIAKSIADGQFQIARLYGFASWPKLRAYVDAQEEIGQLKEAIDTEDFERVKAMMARNPELHRAPLGYAKNGPLTWVAECRVPWGPPSPARLSLAQWMIEHGSDVHQGGDGPLARAALNGQRIPMLELLVAHGADVNALWGGWCPIIFAPCESLDPIVLQWLVDHGANPNRVEPAGRIPGTALDYAIGTYCRSTELPACIDILLRAGGVTRYPQVVVDLLRGRLDLLAQRINADPGLVQRAFPEFDFGSSGARRLTLQGGTLLHVAAEYGSVDAVKLLLERGADVNARAAVDQAGVGGQTPIFHAVTQFNDWGLPAARLLIERGADLAVRVRLPGHYERLDEFVECTPLGYALRFPGGASKSVALLREHGAVE